MPPGIKVVEVSQHLWKDDMQKKGSWAETTAEAASAK